MTRAESLRLDYKMMRLWINLAKYLALTPLPDSSNNCISTLYPILLMILYAAVMVFSCYHKFFMYRSFNVSQIILDVLQALAEFSFVELVILWSIYRRNRWRKLIQYTIQIERSLDRTILGEVEDSKDCRVRFFIVGFHLGHALVHGFDTATNWNLESYHFGFGIMRVVQYYITFSVILITFLCVWLKNRYVYLNWTLQGANDERIATLHKGGATVNRRFVSFSRSYKRLYLVVVEINYLFGCYFFLIAVCTVLEVFNTINYGMPTTRRRTVTKEIMINNGTFLVFHLICYAQMVMVCDSVEKSAKELYKTCFLLYDKTESPNSRFEFQSLAEYIQGLVPQFSASGFWTVNQSALSALFSSAMTYIIIIIQLNMTLT